MIKKTTIYTALFILMVGLISACSGASPTSNTVNLPNVKNGSNATATTAAGAYPAANSAQNQAAYPAANAASAATAYPVAVAAPLSVVKTDGTSTSIAPADLTAIPTNNVTIGAKNYTGIPVLSILVKAGITDYKQLTITGANGSQVLTKDKIDNNVVLTINPDGTLQLISPNLKEEQWLKSVNSVKAE